MGCLLVFGGESVSKLLDDFFGQGDFLLSSINEELRVLSANDFHIIAAGQVIKDTGRQRGEVAHVEPFSLVHFGRRVERQVLSRSKEKVVGQRVEVVGQQLPM